MRRRERCWQRPHSYPAILRPRSTKPGWTTPRVRLVLVRYNDMKPMNTLGNAVTLLVHDIVFVDRLSREITSPTTLWRKT